MVGAEVPPPDRASPHHNFFHQSLSRSFHTNGTFSSSQNATKRSTQVVPRKGANLNMAYNSKVKKQGFIFLVCPSIDYIDPPPPPKKKKEFGPSSSHLFLKNMLGWWADKSWCGWLCELVGPFFSWLPQECRGDLQPFRSHSLAGSRQIFYCISTAQIHFIGLFLEIPGIWSKDFWGQNCAFVGI